MDEEQIGIAMELSTEIVKEVMNQDPKVSTLGCAMAAAKECRRADEPKEEFLKLCGQAWDLSKL